MKKKEKQLARALRSKGWSLRAIAAKTKCSKSAVSGWISDICLTAEQIKNLKSNQDRSRALAAQHPNCSKNKWKRIRDEERRKARKDISGGYSSYDLLVAGTALYWAEGYNASRNSIIFANTDPRMIELMMLFFRKICKVPESKFRGKLFIHPNLDARRAERYWSKISGIGLRQFNKPLIAVSRASLQKRDTLPMGTFSVLIGDVYTCSKIKGWIDGLSFWSNKGG